MNSLKCAAMLRLVIKFKSSDMDLVNYSKIIYKLYHSTVKFTVRKKEIDWIKENGVHKKEN